MILTIINNTVSDIIYTSATLTVPGSGSIAIPQNVLATLAGDAAFINDITVANTSLSNSITIYQGAGALALVDKAVSLLSTLPESYFSTVANLTANQSVTIDVSGYATAALQIEGTWSAGSLSWIGSVDGINFSIVLAATDIVVLDGNIPSLTTVNGFFKLDVTGLKKLKVATDTITGTANVYIGLSKASGVITSILSPLYIQSVGSLPLPAGAATSTLQTTGNTSLNSIDTKFTALNAKDFATQTTLAALNTKVTAVNTGAVVVSGSALPAGAATSALQSTQDTSINTLLKPASTLAAVTNLAQLGGVAIAMGTGARSAGTQRVTVSTDDLIPISAASLPLPALAATSTLQTTQDISINTLLKPASTLAAVTTVATVTNLSQLGGAAIAMGTGVRSAGTLRVTLATDDLISVNAIQATVTKGTQGSTGVTTQALKDAGRNMLNFFMTIPVITTATDTLQSLTGYKSSAAVGTTTTPAVITSGKTFRMNSATLTYVATATGGSAKFTLRANTGGVVAITSPVVCVWIAGGPAVVAGDVETTCVSFPDGLEFAAGTGLGISMVGLSTTQTLAATGYGQITIHGYEY